MRRYTWITPDGGKITTKTIRQFSELTGMRISNATSMACGYRQSLRGYVGMSKRAAKKRKRWTTVLVNTRTGQRERLGQSIKSFAERHDVCGNDLCKLLNGHKIAVKGWVLEKTWNLTHGAIADGNN
jgi:hypothetical protein